MLAEVIANTQVKQAIVTEIGDLLPFWKAKVVNLVVKHIKMRGPDYTLPNAIGFNETLAFGGRRKLEPVAMSGEDLAFLVITGVNTLFDALVNNEQFARLDFSALRLAVGGGTAVQQAVAEPWQTLTGVPILEGYGLTEAAPVISVNPVDNTGFTGNVGLPVPSTEVQLRDEEGNEAPPGKRGELCARGPQVMRGYWQRPEETTRALGNGWLLTGDVATMDEQGCFRIVDRKKDLILVSAFNVFPNEIEEIVMGCEGVLEVACIGVPDDKTGEAVKIFLVPKPGVELTAEAILAHCRKNLTAYKLPRQVEFRDSLPKSNVCKILRRELR